MSEVIGLQPPNDFYEKQLKLCNERIELTNDDVIAQARAYHDRGKLNFQYEFYLKALQDYLAAERRFQMDPPGTHREEMTELEIEIVAVKDWIKAGFEEGGKITLGQSSEASSG